MTIRLKYCSVEWTDTGCLTTFNDGTEIASFPHDIPHYYVIAHRCGYGDDLLTYCRDHDFFHSFCEEYFQNRPSPVLWSLAHGDKIDDSVYEEVMVQACQRWVRASERPIIGCVDWDAFKIRALNLLQQLGWGGLMEKASPIFVIRSMTAHDRDVLVSSYWFNNRDARPRPADRVHHLEVLLEFRIAIMAKLAANDRVHDA